MLTVPTSVALAAIFSATISFLLDFTPFLAGWFNKLANNVQALIVLVITLAVGLYLFFTSNAAALPTATLPDLLTALATLLLNVLVAVGTAQLWHPFINKPLKNAISPGPQG